MIKAAWRMGIRTFDTAFSYADADSILHRALKEINGTDAAVISKVMPVPTLRRKAEGDARLQNGGGGGIGGFIGV